MCFRVLAVPIRAGTAQLIADDSMELRSLLQGSPSIKKCLARLGNRDLVREWYVYAKNHAQIAAPELAAFTMRADNDELAGDVSTSLINAERLLGFRGTPACNASIVELTSAGATKMLSSITHSNTLWEYLPRYEASSKHGAVEYWTAGERVSPMPLTDDDAQVCLLRSLESGDDRIGISDGQFIRFKRTHPERNIFHGFSVDEGEVPAPIAASLKARG